MKSLVVLLVLSACAVAQRWTKTEYHDDLHNHSGVKFVLAAKEEPGAIEVRCSAGKFEDAWLTTDKIVESYGGSVPLEYRRDDESKAHRLDLPVSNSFHGILLQGRGEHGSAMVGFEHLLYGQLGEGRKNRKANNYAKRVILGFREYGDGIVTYNFDVPDPSEIREACGIK